MCGDLLITVAVIKKLHIIYHIANPFRWQSIRLRVCQNSFGPGAVVVVDDATGTLTTINFRGRQPTLINVNLIEIDFDNY